jgi:hypothetical protein
VDRNPALFDPDTGTYAPAYTLTDDDRERAGRVGDMRGKSRGRGKAWQLEGM